MAIISTGSISKALWPGVNAWFGLGYKDYAPEFAEIFDKYSSDKNFEEDVNLYGLGMASVKDESGNISYDDMGQGFTKRYVHLTYALGYIITREAYDDNLYIGLAEKRSKALARAMQQTKEHVAANVLNRAFNSSYVGADGLELCSTAHLKSKGGTFSNELATAADLSEYALEQACIDIQGFEDDASMKQAIRPMKLIVPRQLQFEAKRILGSSGQVDTANNNLNALKSMNILPGGFTVNHYLTDADAFFIKTDCMEGMKYFERTPVSVQDTNDFESNNMKFKAYERYSFGWTDPRGIFGSPGA